MHILGRVLALLRLSMTAICLVAFVPITSSHAMQVDALAIHEPESGTYFGFNIDWGNYSANEVNERLGLPAASYVDFFPFPLTDVDRPLLGRFLDQVDAVGGVAVVTLEPTIPLEEITDGLAHDLASELGGYNERGVRILVRFAHEMNGSWYSWSQQPTDYIAAFRTIADAVHSYAPLTGMLWAPNNGAGYPFTGGAFEASPDDPDFALLDTDRDGVLTESDDPYAPYYPGDDAVDWVGMSLYHWGNVYPWGENELPEPGKFIDMLTGTYDGLDGDRTAVPDFYAEFVDGRGKPLAIVETAAYFQPGAGGAGELEIKQAWWRQVLSADTLRQYPGIRMINWFEWTKPEVEVDNAMVDWTVTTSEPVVGSFLDDLPLDHIHLAPVREPHPVLDPDDAN